MKLTAVGCAGSYPSPQSPASCYLVHEGDTAVLLDLGNGALGGVLRHINPAELTAVVISHLHVDHCIDLTSLYVLLKYGPTQRNSRLPVYGPSGLAQRIAAAYNPDSATDLSDIFDFRVLLPQRPVVIGDATITAFTVSHPGESFGFRVELGGKILAYSGDTDECEALVTLARNADMALFEASFLEPADGEPALPVGLHMSGAMAGRCARRAGAKSLILTHTVAWNMRDGRHDQEKAQAQEHFPGPVAMAVPDMVIHL